MDSPYCTKSFKLLANVELAKKIRLTTAIFIKCRYNGCHEIKTILKSIGWLKVVSTS